MSTLTLASLFSRPWRIAQEEDAEGEEDNTVSVEYVMVSSIENSVELALFRWRLKSRRGLVSRA